MNSIAYENTPPGDRPSFGTISSQRTAGSARGTYFADRITTVLRSVGLLL